MNVRSQRPGTARVLDDPLHWSGPDPTSPWTTVNISELLPGVPTPMTWSFFRGGIDDAFFGGFHALGALSTAELRAPRSPDERSCGIFFGRPALNAGLFRKMGGRMPFTSGDAVEEQLFGGVRFGGEGEETRRRYPVIAFRMPVAMLAAPGRLTQTLASMSEWRRGIVNRPPGPAAARHLLTVAVQRFSAAFNLHTLGTMAAQGQFDQLAKAAAAAGRQGLETQLVSGYGSLVEGELVADLWHLANDSLSVERFMAAHGYHGPSESELASRPWREDSAPMEPVLDRYRGLDDPQESFARARTARKTAERTLLDSVPRWKRPTITVLLRAAERFVPSREVGKAAFLQAVDVARVATRTIGRDMCDRGCLRDPDDVYYLTVDEVLTGDLPSAAELVNCRKARRAEYLMTQLPETWRGMPTPIPMADRNDTAAPTLTGVAAGPGSAEGIAVVVDDPGAIGELEPDSILVCHTTDPSWAPLFFQSAAVVIDVGGPLSHGAIVARELGIPCVINTRTATNTIRTGDTVHVDGSGGVVRVISRRN